MLVRLFAQFVRGQVICFTVCDCSRGVSMRGKVVEFGESIVRTLWHGVLLQLTGRRLPALGRDSALRNVPSPGSDILQGRRLRALRAF